MNVNQSTEKLRRKVIRGLTTMIGLSAGIVSYANFYKGHNLMGFVDAGLCLFCMWVCFQHMKGRDTKWHRYAILLLYVLANVLVSALNGLLTGVSAWLLTFPIVFYLILGSFWGLRLSGLMLIVMTTVLYSNTTNIDPVLIRSIMINLVLSYCVIWATSHIYEASRQHNEVALLDMAHRDPLTCAFNRSALTEHFLSNANNCILVLIDIDDFKQINDTFGHEVGDRVLIELSNLITDELTNIKLYRIGGEEFVIMFENTSKDEVRVRIDQLIKSIEASYFTDMETNIKITVSIGVSDPIKNAPLATLLKIADKRLYTAKHNGKNQVVYE